MKKDMNRYPSPIVKLAFEGPDVQEEILYELCRVSDSSSKYSTYYMASSLMEE